MAKKSEYVIGFTGLPDGQHLFSFEIGKTFFEQLDYSEIQDAKLKVKMVLDKNQTMMLASFDIKGKVNIMCDLCTDYFDLTIKGKNEIIYKFSEEDLDDEKIITVKNSETEINVAQPIYEFTALLLPVRRIHPKGKCNQEMLKSIDEYLMVEIPKNNKPQKVGPSNDEEIDPRWAALKKLKK